MGRFKNKICVVAGGASGMGAATVKKLSGEGAIVYVLDKIKKNNTPDIYYYNCDLCDSESYHNRIKSIEEKHQRIDFLCITSGIHVSGTIEENSQEQIESIWQNNFFSTVNLLKKILPIMKKNRCGSIVLMGSDQSKIAKPSQAMYGATKAAIAHLAKSITIDYAEFNIRANCVCPGTIETPFVLNNIEKYSKQVNIPVSQLMDSLENAQPIKRVGTAEEVANMIVFLGSDEASFITGTTIMVDGGYTAQ